VERGRDAVAAVGEQVDQGLVVDRQMVLGPQEGREFVRQPV
jgi:hypothetical protein